MTIGILEGLAWLGPRMVRERRRKARVAHVEQALERRALGLTAPEPVPLETPAARLLNRVAL